MRCVEKCPTGYTNSEQSGEQSCAEICGDGLHMGSLPCDDGNLRNGDGCSSDCEEEEGFTCEIGTVESPSICIELVKPTITNVNVVNDDNDIMIHFSELMDLTLTRSEDFGIKVENLEEEDVKISAFDAQRNVQILDFAIEFSEDIQDGQLMTLWVRNDKLNHFQNMNGNPLQATNQLTVKLRDNFMYTQGEAQLMTGFKMMTGEGIIISTTTLFVVALITGQSLSLLISFIAILQIFISIAFIQIDLPSNFLEVLRTLRQMTSGKIPVSNIFITSQKEDDHGFDPKFTAMGIECSSIFENGWSLFLALVGLILVQICFNLIASRWSPKFLSRIRDRFLYGAYIRYIQLAFMELCMVSMIPMVESHLGSSLGKADFCVATLFLVICFVFPIINSSLLILYRGRLAEEKIIQKYGASFLNLNPKSTCSLLYYSFYLWRRILHQSTLVYLRTSGRLQLSIALFLSFTMVIYSHLFQPFIKKSERIFYLVNELFVAVAFAGLISYEALYYNIDRSLKRKIGWLMIAALLLMIVTNLGYITLNLARGLFHGKKNFEREKAEFSTLLSRRDLYGGSRTPVHNLATASTPLKPLVEKQAGYRRTQTAVTNFELASSATGNSNEDIFSWEDGDGSDRKMINSVRTPQLKKNVMLAFGSSYNLGSSPPDSNLNTIISTSELDLSLPGSPELW
eukprot:CAMPEP_0114983588 /NCGR_PEP_ID=MMETSP0216-20121206/6784_1 /TAXON_ID=223996 /ORGANISM="Protocruzia adherens, Strain Boccale" /LENGTH=683 /DNA_ID=CAMNT_0002345589 /DNA_START=388 /DNA_END=2437 /DNA_ORIENTATION=-